MSDCLNLNKVLKNDGVIAFPTDTVWGIGCVVGSKKAVDKIYSIKIRDKKKPLILLSSKMEYFYPYIANFSDVEKKIADSYWPGALTLVVKKSLKTPDYMTSGLDSVGIRVPNCPVLLEILEKNVDGHVLATTSANLSGSVASSTYQEVASSIGDDLDYIVSDDFVPKGVESTVVKVDEFNEINILRQGAITVNI